MTTIALIVQPVAFTALLWLVLRHVQGREAAHTAAVDRLAQMGQETAQRLILSVEGEREARRDEIATLLQRIQAPREAVVQHMRGNPDDDEPMPMAEHESAARLDAETAAEIARMEASMNASLGLAIPTDLT